MADGEEAAPSSTVQALQDDVRALVREEVNKVRTELGGRARAAGAAGALVAGAGVLGLLAVGTAGALVVRAFDRVLPPIAAAGAATAVFGGGAAALGAVGVRQLRQTRDELAETGRSAGRDMRTAVGAAAGAAGEAARETTRGRTE
ncbi:phage holin family protein [Pseudonocardia halophobica]|uniref:phage holin family protein n=1 Tax=Pseudonocardia halophobica TaxID=29401 RepID=UPI003D910BB8